MKKQDLEIKKRFIDVFNELKKEQIIKGVSDFAIKINVQQPNVSAVVTGKRKVPQDLLNKLFSTFRIVNKEYIYTGEGDKLKSEASQESVKPPMPTQLDIDFSKIAEANLKIANAVESMTVTAERNSRTMEKTTDNNTKLIDANTELIEKLLSAIDRIEKKIDKKGAVAGAGGVAKPAVQG
jgi:hypothetical protein